MTQNKFVPLMYTPEVGKETCIETRERENGTAQLRISNSEATVALQTKIIVKMH